MYSGSGFTVSELGDVDVVYVDGIYHLFHLVLPNHDYIAHAVSQDGFVWRRVENALFIGHPGQWDDDMLWTMHVSRNPYQPNEWRMFYTGLSRQESGRIQRVGLARSADLYHWEKMIPVIIPSKYRVHIMSPAYLKVEIGLVFAIPVFFLMERTIFYWPTPESKSGLLSGEAAYHLLVKPVPIVLSLWSRYFSRECTMTWKFQVCSR